MKTTILSMLLLATVVSFTQIQTVHFDKDSYALTAKETAELDQLIAKNEQEQYRGPLYLSGHTDKDASDDYNKVLSSNRAKAVKAYLIDAAVENDIHIESNGESQLIYEGDEQEGMAPNRRVEIRKTPLYENTAFEHFKVPAQEFEINPNEESTITTAGGTVITIPKNALDVRNGTSSILISVEEYNDKASYVLGNLVTKTTDRGMLETGGMFYIEASDAGSKVDLKDGQDIQIQFASRTEDDGMSLWQGEKSGDEILWKEAEPTAQTAITEGNNFGWCWISKDGDKEVKWEYRTFTKEIDGELFRITQTTNKMNETETFDTVSIQQEVAMSNLVMSSSKMGWINCDRFSRSRAPKTDIYVEYEGDFAPKVVMVFADINSVMPSSFREDNLLVFRNIPTGMNVELIGLYDDNEQPGMLFGKKNYTTRANGNVKLDFKVQSEDDIKASVASLN